MTELDTTDANVVVAPMPLAHFETLIASHGADPARWPARTRAAAQALLERSVEARDALADAALLDRLLDANEAPAPSDDLTRTLHRRFAERRKSSWPARPSPRRFLAGWLMRPRVAMAGIAALVVLAVAVTQTGLGPTVAPNGPSVAHVFPPIELDEDGFVGENGLTEPEIALVDPVVALFATEGLPLEDGPTLAGGPLPDALPLD